MHHTLNRHRTITNLQYHLSPQSHHTYWPISPISHNTSQTCNRTIENGISHPCLLCLSTASHHYVILLHELCDTASRKIAMTNSQYCHTQTHNIVMLDSQQTLTMTPSHHTPITSVLPVKSPYALYTYSPCTCIKSPYALSLNNQLYYLSIHHLYYTPNHPCTIYPLTYRPLDLVW